MHDPAGEDLTHGELLPRELRREEQRNTPVLRVAIVRPLQGEIAVSVAADQQGPGFRDSIG
jgi:hypothetical protein